MLKKRQLTFVIFCLMALAACATRPAVPDLVPVNTFTPAAAQYLTTYRAKGKEDVRSLQWRLWRQPNRIVTENISAHTGELWQQDGAAVFHQKIFHEDRRSIEYRMDDLALSATAVDWPKRSLLIDPALLDRLQLKNSGWKRDVPYRRYTGDADGSRWDITIRTDLMLPVRIVRVHDEMREQTELQEAYELGLAPWSPTVSTDYEVIDFADLGDRQSDPFVQKIQGFLGQSPHLH